MADYLTPVIGQSGAFSFRAPFDGYDNVILRVEGMRRVLSFSNDNIDIRKDLYEGNNVSGADTEQDFNNNVNVVFFSTSNKEALWIPESFIVTIPRSDGIVYHELTLVTALGAVPADTNTALLEAKIKQEVLGLYGVNAVVKPVVVSWDTLLSISEHVSLTQSRLSAQQNVPNCQVELVRAKRQIDILMTRLRGLEAFIMGGLTSFKAGDVCKDMEAAFEGATYLEIGDDLYILVSRSDQSVLQRFGIYYRPGFTRSGKWWLLKQRQSKKKR